MALAMKGDSGGALTAHGKLPCAGEWRAQVSFGGCADYDSCTSTVKAFVVQDPRIGPAIARAKRRLGSHEWDHYCMRFVCDAYTDGAGAKIHRYANAK